MGREQESAAAEVERLTRLRDKAEKGSAEHRELNHKLVKARRRLYEIELGRRRRALGRPCGCLEFPTDYLHLKAGD